MNKCIDVLGIGFGCVDYIYTEGNNDYYKPMIMNGGTCLNVLTVLAQLGANVEMLMAGTKKSDIYRQFVDYSTKLNVKIRFMKQDEYPLPICIQVNSGTDHSFKMICPLCNKKMKYVLWGRNTKDIQEVINEPMAKVLFIDRINYGSKKMAQEYFRAHKTIVYEPNSSRNTGVILEMSRVCDILKFSFSKVSKQIANRIINESINTNLKLLIATKGERGLEFCYRNDGTKPFSDWVELKPRNIVGGGDSSGSGDWMTAGFINKFILLKEGRVEYSLESIKEALSYAMGLSEFANQAVGAQGVFFDMNLIHKLNKSYQTILETPLVFSDYRLENTSSTNCPLCGQKTD